MAWGRGGGEFVWNGSSNRYNFAGDPWVEIMIQGEQKSRNMEANKIRRSNSGPNQQIYKYKYDEPDKKLKFVQFHFSR